MEARIIERRSNAHAARKVSIAHGCEAASEAAGRGVGEGAGQRGFVFARGAAVVPKASG